MAGFPKVYAKDLVKGLVEQVAPFNPLYNLGERAETLSKEGDLFRVTTSLGNTFTAKAVIIAAGVGAFEPRRLGPRGRGSSRGRASTTP